MPLPVGMGVLPLDTFLADLGCENRAKPIPPKPHRLVTDNDPSLVQQVFNISKGKWKSHIHHHCQADDFRRRLKVAKGRRFCHPQSLRNPPALFKSVSSDTAPLPVLVYAHPADTVSADHGSEDRTEPVPPETDSFVTDFDAPFVQQVFDIAQQ